MKWRTTSSFVCQSWTVVFLSLLACGIGLCQIGIGIWLSIFSDRFLLLLGELLRTALLGYVAIGAATSVMCLFGMISALLRNRCGTILYGVFLLASIPSQAGVWTYIFLELLRVSEVLRERIQSQSVYYDALAREFNCNLDSTAEVQSDQAIESCTTFVNEWLQTIVWAMLGLCVALICIQFILLIMTAMLNQLISEELKRNRMRITPLQGDSIPLSVTSVVSRDASKQCADSAQDGVIGTPMPNAPKVRDTEAAQSPFVRNSSNPNTNVQVNTNVDVTANVTVNSGDLRGMVSRPASNLPQDAAVCEPSPGFPHTEKSPPFNPEWPPINKTKFRVGI